jgi:parallel beta helix pectate lyase-like protein
VEIFQFKCLSHLLSDIFNFCCGGIDTVKNISVGIVILSFIIMLSPSLAEYATPGNSLVYTLDDLIAVSAGTLEYQEPLYIINDRLTISENDTLVVSSQSIIIRFHDFDNNICPMLQVEGKLIADDMNIGSLQEDLDNFLPVRGIWIGAASVTAEAEFTSCTFRKIQSVTVRNNANVEIKKSKFEECTKVGLHAFSGANLTVTDTTFNQSPVHIMESTIKMENCSFVQASVSLTEVSGDSYIRGCDFVDSGNIAIYIQDGSPFDVSNNRILNCLYGVSVYGNSTARFQKNVIKNSVNGGIVTGDEAAPLFRENIISENALNPPRCDGSFSLPAIFVMGSSNADFGSSEDPGKNTIQNNIIALYHAGTSDINAIGNCWGVSSKADLENIIYHKVDDAEDADGSGFISAEVNYLPFTMPFTPYTGKGFLIR